MARIENSGWRSWETKSEEFRHKDWASSLTWQGVQGRRLRTLGRVKQVVEWGALLSRVGC